MSPAGHHGGGYHVQVAAVDELARVRVQRSVHVPRPDVGAAAYPEVHGGSAVRAQHHHVGRLDARYLGHGPVLDALVAPRVQRVHATALPEGEVHVVPGAPVHGHQVQRHPFTVVRGRHLLRQRNRVQPPAVRVVHRHRGPARVRHVHVQPAARRPPGHHVLELAVRPGDGRQVHRLDHLVRGQVDGDQLRRADPQRPTPRLRVRHARVQHPQHAGIRVRVHRVDDADGGVGTAGARPVVSVPGERPDVRFEVDRVQPESAQRPRNARVRRAGHDHVRAFVVHLHAARQHLTRLVPAVQYVVALVVHRRPLKVGAGQQERAVFVGR